MERIESQLELFIEEVNQYDGLLEFMMSIEGYY